MTTLTATPTATPSIEAPQPSPPATPLDHFARQVYRAHLRHMADVMYGDAEASVRFMATINNIFDSGPHAYAIKREEMDRLPSGTREVIEKIIGSLPKHV